ncbi:MAG TPA: Fic family protein [Gemmatimonadaceae bacterium]|jgi:Fic family protein|nr:Fic family protein [Gemmatimonadaceae bacterium]
MTWNWQHLDWPNFTWDEPRLRKAEEHFLLGSGRFAGTIKHLNGQDQEQLTIEAISTEALTTSEIEGEILDRASVQSSIRRQLGLATDHRRVRPAEQGIAEMMVSLYRSFSEPLSNELLFGWHTMLTNGRRDLKNIGRYRTDEEPMQVVSGSLHAPKVHFEAPPSARVPKEMARFVKWFNRTAPGGTDPLPTLTRAGIAHLYFESIHPFEDGNGRIGRAIAEKALAQSVGEPTLTALAATILIRRKAYYEMLEVANKDNNLTPWLCWFAGVAIEAQKRTEAHVEFLLDKTRLLDRLRGQLNARQEKAMLRMLREGPEGFTGGLSAGNYMTITGASPATATRDLADLVDKKALYRIGERRHARYEVAIGLRPVPRVEIDADGNLHWRS